MRIKSSPETESKLALVLHTRAYSETSLLVDLFTLEYGRISCIAKGAKRPKSKFRGILQPFMPLSIFYKGNGSLYTLTECDLAGPQFNLVGKVLVCGLYLNELLTRLLPPGDPCSLLFKKYHELLNNLPEIERLQYNLRIFEKFLLKSIGYELPLLFEANTSEKIQIDADYSFDPERGPIALYSYTQLETNAIVYKGQYFLDLYNERFTNNDSLVAAKYIMRKALERYLGDRPLAARKLL